MKKLLLWFLAFGYVIFRNFLFAQSNENITQYFSDLGGGDLFGYSENNQISVTNISSDSISIVSPVIKNENNESITQYNILYSENILSDVINDPALIDSLHEKKITTNESDNFSFSLYSTGDELDVEKIYYFSVAPKDDSWIIGAVSDEYCFNLENEIYAKIEDDKTICSQKIDEKKELETEKESIHNAAGADMSLANITHTVDWNSIVLNWIAIEWSDTLEIFLLNEDKTEDGEPVWEKLGTADMLDGEFRFPYQWDHSTRVLFKPDNGWMEYEYTLNFTPPVEKEEPTIEEQPEPTITVVPQTGTKENFLVIFIISLLGFVLYRAMRKSK